MHCRSKYLGSFELLPSGNNMISSSLLLLKSNIPMMLECKAHNVGSNVVDVIRRLPKTASKCSAADEINFR